jgi:hypothetical protein
MLMKELGTREKDVMEVVCGVLFALLTNASST